MRFSFSQSGSFDKTDRLLRKLKTLDIASIVAAQAQRGVVALSHATPVDTGRAASSWTYEIKKTAKATTIVWKNTDVEGELNIVLAMQYGHGTGTGGWVQGRDFINPAMRPIFKSIAETVRRAVISA